MIRLLIAALFACLSIGQANAQFPGYPPLNYFYIGQGAAGVPQWIAPPAARTSMGLGTMATQNANAVAITGGTATGFPLPTNPPDVATKQYVDSNTTGLTIHPSVNLATTGALPTNNYNNGAAGVGATLTASCSSSCAAPTIDGSAATLGLRILVKNEAATPNNGIYTVTQVGTGATPYILTRATDANTAGNAEFQRHRCWHLCSGHRRHDQRQHRLGGAVANHRDWHQPDYLVAVFRECGRVVDRRPAGRVHLRLRHFMRRQCPEYRGAANAAGAIDVDDEYAGDDSDGGQPEHNPL